ncbi:NAD(P)/FAD-dependent oxidoreductase [Formicincola oecophyllae]|nr:FAD-dependent oxidoreductase [Formicincola oecophyllae]
MSEPNATNTPASHPHQNVVILGGGIGGLAAAISLQRRSDIHVTLVDPNAVHVWKPLFDELATGTMPFKGNLFPFDELARRFNFSFVQDKPASVDRSAKSVTLEGGITLPYDALIVSMGARSNDFGTPGAQDNCLFLDKVDQARVLYDHFWNGMAKAHATSEPLKVAVVGGGPTGVELSGNFVEAIDRTKGLGKKGREQLFRASLLEASPRILNRMPENVSVSMTREMSKIGYQVLDHTAVAEVTDKGFKLKSGQFVEADVRVWAAGVKAVDGTAIFAELERNRMGQLVVGPTLQTTQDPAIFALGDCSAIAEKPLPSTAQVANQQGFYAGYAVQDFLAGRKPGNFVFNNRGVIVMLGDFDAWYVAPSDKDFGGTGLCGKIVGMAHRSLYYKYLASLFGPVSAAERLIGHLLHPEPPHSPF